MTGIDTASADESEGVLLFAGVGAGAGAGTDNVTCSTSESESASPPLLPFFLRLFRPRSPKVGAEKSKRPTIRYAAFAVAEVPKLMSRSTELRWCRASILANNAFPSREALNFVKAFVFAAPNSIFLEYNSHNPIKTS